MGNYADAVQFLYGLRWFGAKFGLTNTRKLAALAGNPQQKLRFIHVAGTNGKGSTCAMLEAIYRAAGLKVGLFTSPHLVSFCERIQVNRQLISREAVADLVSEFKPILASFPPEEHPTFFEVVTVMALQYFVRQGCELVVWETGLGGRLDATNIVDPLASVITNIQLDHQQYLGDTLGQIASEKAGIIKAGRPVITGADNPEALGVIKAIAAERNAPLTIVKPEDLNCPPLSGLELPLLGEHQRRNAAVAIATVRALHSTVPCDDHFVCDGLSRVDWPGRLQVIKRPSGQKLALDGAHNPGGAESLATAIRSCFPGSRPVFILGILKDKDWIPMCQALAPLASRVLLVPVHSERSAEPAELATACRQLNLTIEVEACASLAHALAAVETAPFVVIAGSLYLVGEAIESLRLSPGLNDERSLNEWSVPADKR